MARTLNDKWGPASEGGTKGELDSGHVVIGRGDPELEKLIGKPISRKWDIMLVVAVIGLVPAAMQLTQFLLVGDWDFWSDWKDRQWWPTVTPPVNIIVPSALQYVTWSQLRLPIGATAGTLLMTVGQLTIRMFGWTTWGYMPMNFVWPAMLIPAGVALDVILFYSRSFLITSFFGGLVWGMMFQPMNSVLFAQYWQPVVYHGTTLTLADVMSFNYPRNQTPNYLRIVEQGKFRAFLSQISFVVALFSGFISGFFYWIGQFVGRKLAVGSAYVYYRGQGGAGAKNMDDVKEHQIEREALPPRTTAI